MLCKKCGKANVVQGSIEGVSFVPIAESKRMFATGVYGIEATVCPECGDISELRLDTGALKKILKTKRKT